MPPVIALPYRVLTPSVRVPGREGIFTLTVRLWRHKIEFVIPPELLNGRCLTLMLSSPHEPRRGWSVSCWRRRAGPSGTLHLLRDPQAYLPYIRDHHWDEALAFFAELEAHLAQADSSPLLLRMTSWKRPRYIHPASIDLFATPLS